MTAREEGKKRRALLAAVRLLRGLDERLELVGAPVAACHVAEARIAITHHYRALLERRRAR